MRQNEEIPATRIKFDSATSQYLVYNVTGQGNSKVRGVPIEPGRLQRYNKKLVQSATDHPNKWMGPTIQDANVNTGDAPLDICTNVVCGYQQLNNPYCIGYSFASALLYCGFRAAAERMHNAAPVVATLDYDGQIQQILSFARNNVPLIGQPTIFGIRTNRHDHKKRTLDWITLFSERTPYPTVVIPILPDGRRTHAFCVVDDIIFDSTNPCALQLRMESVVWLFRDCRPEISHAFRFNTKISPKNTKIRAQYKRQMKENW
jgi:hypothetical protein